MALNLVRTTRRRRRELKSDFASSSLSSASARLACVAFVSAASAAAAARTRSIHTDSLHRHSHDSSRRPSTSYSRLDVLGKWRYRRPPPSSSPSSPSSPPSEPRRIGQITPPGGLDVRDLSGELKRSSGVNDKNRVGAEEEAGNQGSSSKKPIAIPFDATPADDQPDHQPASKSSSKTIVAAAADAAGDGGERTQPLVVEGISIPVRPKPPGEEGESSPNFFLISLFRSFPYGSSLVGWRCEGSFGGRTLGG